MSEAEAVSKFIHDGDYIGTELYGTVRCPMSLVNEVVRQGKKDLLVAGQGVLEPRVPGALVEHLSDS